MKNLKIFCAAFLLGGCMPMPAVVLTNSTATAQEYIGLHEWRNRNQIKDLTGVDPVRTEWCAAFVNAVLELDNIPGSESVSDVPLMARSFLKWGEAVEPADIQRGDIVIFPRGNTGWQGHVGFYVTTQMHNGKEYWIILGGNQNNEVRYDFYSPNRALGIRRYQINTTAQQSLWGSNPVDLERQGVNKWEDH